MTRAEIEAEMKRAVRAAKPSTGILLTDWNEGHPRTLAVRRPARHEGVYLVMLNMPQSPWRERLEQDTRWRPERAAPRLRVTAD
jgi:hypothetical protein